MVLVRAVDTIMVRTEVIMITTMTMIIIMNMEADALMNNSIIIHTAIVLQICIAKITYPR